MSSLPQHEANGDLLVVCKASADKLRLQILGILRNESFGVTELCQVFNVAQPNMTHHLKILASAGLVQTRKEGTFVFYRRALTANADPFSGLKQNSMTLLTLNPSQQLSRSGSVKFTDRGLNDHSHFLHDTHTRFQRIRTLSRP